MTRDQVIKLIHSPGHSKTLWHIAMTGKGEYAIAPSCSPSARRISRMTGVIGKELDSEGIQNAL